MSALTPETDAACWSDESYGLNSKIVHAEFARKLERGRNEARAVAYGLAFIASHCLGWHDNTNPETIADAIKRWNAASKK